jgi:hypothetical protein
VLHPTLPQLFERRRCRKHIAKRGNGEEEHDSSERWFLRVRLQWTPLSDLLCVCSERTASRGTGRKVNLADRDLP